MQKHNTERANVLGVGVHALGMRRATELINDTVARNAKGYVSVTGVHGVMEALHDPQFRMILNRSLLVVPDGMPTVWVGRLQGHREISRVYGPDLMTELCKLSVEKGYTHFLYGGQGGVVEELKAGLIRRFPGIRIVGAYTPPFRPLNQHEQQDLAARVSSSAPDFFWVGLSTPKQERFMADYLPKLDTKVMLGVGAAFDIHTGRTKDAPAWIKVLGLQWAHRLCHEPRRLWRRYLSNNPAFLFWISIQFLQLRRFSFDD